jgi:hypothetical protein
MSDTCHYIYVQVQDIDEKPGPEYPVAVLVCEEQEVAAYIGTVLEWILSRPMDEEGNIINQGHSIGSLSDRDLSIYSPTDLTVNRRTVKLLTDEDSTQRLGNHNQIISMATGEKTLGAVVEAYRQGLTTWAEMLERAVIKQTRIIGELREKLED